MISYHIKDLTVSSPEAVAFQIGRVASCLWPPGTRLFSRMAFSSAAVHSTSRLGGICSFCPKFSSIHAASFEGSQRIIGWDLRIGYSSLPCPASWPSSVQTTSGCPGFLDGHPRLMIDNPLQASGPYPIPVVVDSIDDLLILRVYEQGRHRTPRVVHWIRSGPGLRCTALADSRFRIIFLMQLIMRRVLALLGQKCIHRIGYDLLRLESV